MKTSLKILAATCFGILAMISCRASFAQDFSIDTVVTQPANGLYSYSFTFNYDQGGVTPTLTDPVYDWTLFLDPNTPSPTAIALPTGWKSSYDSPSGQFDFYTEGPNGFGSGDFGPDVIQPGQSLSGFGLTTPAAPDQSIAFATDEQFNQDATTATLPTSIPAIPEASTTVSFALLLALGLGGIIAARKRTRRAD